MTGFIDKVRGKPIYLMADIGLTCGGDYERTIKLIELAGQLGFDAVKLQMLVAEELLGDHKVTYTYPTMSHGNKTENMVEMFKKLEFSDAEWAEITQKISSLSMDPIITCHYEGGVERVNRLNLGVNKICTWSLSHQRMINSLAENGKPLLLDTGTINETQLISLRDRYRDYYNQDIIVLHDFHTNSPTEMNFRAMLRLEELGITFGYTPQGRKDWFDYMAIGLGAKIIEKRLTISRQIPENGHWKAHEPEEMKVWIANVKECVEALGRKEIVPTYQDLEDAKKYYKSAWLANPKKAGDIITDSDIVFKRPGIGISSVAWYDELGGEAIARLDINSDTLLSKEMLK